MSLRLSTAKIERVNQRLQIVLERFAREIETGAIVSVGDVDVRIRTLPLGAADQEPVP